MTRTLVFCLGSPQGDDQLGWLVAERLTSIGLQTDVSIRRAISPTAMLDALDEIDQLIVCDACKSLGSPGTVHRWRWPQVRLAGLRGVGSHDLGLGEVLQLAEQLGLLPIEVIIYAVEIGPSAPTSPLSDRIEAAVTLLEEEIARVLGS